MKGKSLAITLLLLIFLGQGIAANVIPCQMDMTSQVMSTNDKSDDVIDPLGYDMGTTDLGFMEKINCELDCNCPMATCLSVFVTSTSNLSSTEPASLKINVSASTETIQTLSSLYRPPITR